MRSTIAEIDRYLAAALAGGVVSALTSSLESYYLGWCIELTLLFFDFDGWSNYLMASGIMVTPYAVLGGLFAVGVYRLQIRKEIGGICRCRKCGYILKGITEPKCSECGEVI
jgi:hypothetical protein